jgi:hypothetical protein
MYCLFILEVFFMFGRTVQTALSSYNLREIATRLKMYAPPPPPPPPPPPALQSLVGPGLLKKQMSPATSILGSRQPVSTTQFPCLFFYPINPS